MKKSMIVFIELGMLVGVIIAGYTLPGSTPLPVFIIGSGICFALGNILLVRKTKQIKAGNSQAKGGPWPHLFRAFAILAIFWLLSFLFFRR